jgi:hypothetical protein
MRWRIRLYCSHIVETTAHRTHTTISSALGGSRTCPTCGLDPSTVVCAVPLGLMTDPAAPPSDPAELEAELARVARRATTAEREHRDLVAQAERLRRQIDAARSGKRYRRSSICRSRRRQSCSPAWLPHTPPRTRVDEHIRAAAGPSHGTQRQTSQQLATAIGGTTRMQDVSPRHSGAAEVTARRALIEGHAVT